jgi:NitT/TauT family transport system substrate-binding protein
VRLILTLIFTCAIVRAGEPLRVSVTRMSVSAPLFYAQEHGLFKKAGLAVELREFELGKTSVEEMLAGKLDVAFAAVTPLVYKCMEGEQFRILGTVGASTGLVALAARKDFGIQTLADVRGKRVGVVRQTSGEFFFDTLRVLNRIPRDSVHIENRSVQGLDAGMRDGTLDAAVMWEPQLQMLRMSLTNRLILFYGEGLYTFSWNMVVLPDTIQKRRGELEKFMDALFEAADLIEANPTAAAAELIARLGAQGRELTIGFKDNRYRPQLGQELLVQMEGEARWIISRDNRTNTPPNVLRWVDTSILKKSHGSAVTVIQ